MNLQFRGDLAQPLTLEQALLIAALLFLAFLLFCLGLGWSRFQSKSGTSWSCGAISAILTFLVSGLLAQLVIIPGHGDLEIYGLGVLLCSIPSVTGLIFGSLLLPDFEIKMSETAAIPSSSGSSPESV